MHMYMNGERSLCEFNEFFDEIMRKTGLAAVPAPTLSEDEGKCIYDLLDKCRYVSVPDYAGANEHYYHSDDVVKSMKEYALQFQRSGGEQKTFTIDDMKRCWEWGGNLKRKSFEEYIKSLSK